jgi:hypothetical protein
MSDIKTVGVDPARILAEEGSLDGWDLVICSSCGLIEDRSEVPGGQCAVTGEGMDWCPVCLDADCFSSYTVEKAAIIAARIEEKRLGGQR